MAQLTRGAFLVVCWLGAFVCPSRASAQTAYDGFDPGANDLVLTYAFQSDGRILVGGRFTMLGGGGSGTSVRNYLGRLNIDGSIDAGFNPGASAEVYAMALQTNGKVVVGGLFTTLAGSQRNRVARLNSDGTLDVPFSPDANGDVYALVIQPDGKIVLGGAFTIVNGVPRNHLARLQADGSLDPTFDPGANAPVSALALQRDNRILVGGFFTALGPDSTPRSHLGRLYANGTLDVTFDPGANGRVKGIGIQADGRVVVGGYFTTLGGGGIGNTPRNYLGRLEASGAIDASFDPNASDAVYTVAVQTDGKVLVGGHFTAIGGVSRLHLARITLGGALDTNFNPGASGDVHAFLEQPDRKILTGGDFSAVGGGTGTATPRHFIGRLYVDGSVDVDFNPGMGGSRLAVAVQPDGNIVVGGGSLTPQQTPTPTLARVRADGTFDIGFNVSGDGGVNALLIQPDGKIVVGGEFTTLSGSGGGQTSRHNIGRLNVDGSVDSSFDPGMNGPVFALALQSDGKIIVSGSYSTIGGGGTGSTPRSGLTRLNVDGTIDAGFADHVGGYSVAVQPDGKILLGNAGISRLNADGSVDVSFDPGANGAVYQVAVNPNGKILLGGYFTMLGGGGTGNTPRTYLGQLNSDGSLDATFDPGTNAGINQGGYSWPVSLQADAAAFAQGSDGSAWPVLRRLDAAGAADSSFAAVRGSWVLSGLGIQPDGKVLAVGYFHWLQDHNGLGPTRDYVGRVTNSGAATQRLTVTGVGHSVVTWMRGGTSPEVWRVTFESSTDDETYTMLGAGMHIPGGWQLSGVTLPTNQNLFIRARGYYATGQWSGSGSIVESVRNVYLSVAFADDPLTADLSYIRAVHITELRTRIDGLRIVNNLAAYAWTDPTLSPASSVVRAQHILDLREALRQVYVALSMAEPVYVDPSLAAGALVKAVHIQQLRAYVLGIE